MAAGSFASQADAAIQPGQQTESQSTGAASYAQRCAACHGDQRQGHPPSFPSLIGVGQRMTAEQIAKQIRSGKGSMPPFPGLSDQEVQALVHYLTAPEPTGAATMSDTQANASATPPSSAVEAGSALFEQNCAFCHGRDAEGGETGPDLTRSKLVLSDTTGAKISSVVHEGRPGTKMPAFNFSTQQMESIIAFLRMRVIAANAEKGERRGVDVSDLQTGNAAAGKAYFYGAGGCSKCHSPTGDLAGIATRYQGLQLERRMLYPRDAKSTVTVTLPSGKTISGTLAYQDEFTIGLRDSSGRYHSWEASRVKYKVDSPVDAHVEQFAKYTDDDIHNLMAYLQTLR